MAHDVLAHMLDAVVSMDQFDFGDLVSPVEEVFGVKGLPQEILCRASLGFNFPA